MIERMLLKPQKAANSHNVIRDVKHDVHQVKTQLDNPL